MSEKPFDKKKESRNSKKPQRKAQPLNTTIEERISSELAEKLKKIKHKKTN